MELRKRKKELDNITKLVVGRVRDGEISAKAKNVAPLNSSIGKKKTTDEDYR